MKIEVDSNAKVLVRLSQEEIRQAIELFAYVSEGVTLPDEFELRTSLLGARVNGVAV